MEHIIDQIDKMREHLIKIDTIYEDLPEHVRREFENSFEPETKPSYLIRIFDIVMDDMKDIVWEGRYQDF